MLAGAHKVLSKKFSRVVGLHAVQRRYDIVEVISQFTQVAVFGAEKYAGEVIQRADAKSSRDRRIRSPQCLRA
jgi:hypothetical protein